MDIGHAAAPQLLDNIEERLFNKWILRDVAVTAERRQANTHATRTALSHERFDDFHQETRTAFNVAAIAVGARVKHRVHELLENIAVGCMEFDTVCTGSSCVGGSFGESAGHGRHLVRAKRPWRVRGHELQLSVRTVGEHLRSLRPLCGRPDRSLAIWQKRGMGEPADMPQLHENRAAMTVNLISHEAPALHLGFRVMAWCARVAMAGLVDVAWLRDDETGACPLTVILGHQ